MNTALNNAAQIQAAAYPKTDPRIKKVMGAIAIHKKKPDALIEVLHAAQGAFGYLPLGVIQLIAKELKVPPSRVYGVSTFYHYFSLKPKGDHTVLVCTGTACFVKGAQSILDNIFHLFNLKAGETTKDGKIGLQTARCIGACSLAPAVVFDEEIIAKTTPEHITDRMTKLLEVK